MIDQLHGKGNVVVFTMPGQANLDDRLRGYRDTFATQQIKIERVVDIKGDPVVAFDTTKEIVEKGRERHTMFWHRLDERSTEFRRIDITAAGLPAGGRDVIDAPAYDIVRHCPHLVCRKLEIYWSQSCTR